mmetsp:Transcript_61182/g.162594  ORF Transcript_61182/g.162594 Transcript_61182/m.162594 type:complete len:215 (-) Transcript_61182:349-993(-)|eukprot:CAMPEP_0194495300 /NCGR_PEP_ID=MMETSP0253-20130528/12952_1 /TAXON_ID=2966 /ORGANISM="Noctiluca scintillans" /LENGTH=214 /DNA_ID=CAMNT_0039336547 /DNA_START=34 /DNA_END=678 /DNA_ORIENTATION=-
MQQNRRRTRDAGLVKNEGSAKDAPHPKDPPAPDTSPATRRRRTLDGPLCTASAGAGEEQSEVIKVAELMSKLRQAQELTKRRVAAGQASDSQAEELRLAAFCATTQPETKIEPIANELCEEVSEAQKPVSMCTQLTERARDSWTELAQVLRRCAPLDEQACALRRSQEAGAVAAAVLSAHLTGHGANGMQFVLDSQPREEVVFSDVLAAFKGTP